MEVVGRSRAKAIIETHLNDSLVYFSDHVRILKCNPYCTGVTYLKEHGVYQWIFQVNDPRENPITAVFFVTQNEEHLDSSRTVPAGPVSEEESFPDSAVSGRCIQWVNAPQVPDVPLKEKNTFVGQANTRICLMPEGILKFMTEAVMSKIMQQATESMLCQVQSDLCCCTTAELDASGGKV